ncbi:imm11 family protein [uncultured Bradyrhizobium sp.]|uniref:imm11 family protein n=1 Tax=uncultured Bradyrhizobium sp. TaxID=199684 RepID=UPI0035C9E468
MAYIIRANLAYKLGKTEIEYFEDDRKTLRAFFDRTDAFPGTVTSASWVTGTWIPPEVVPRQLRLTKGKKMYDWLTLRGGGTLVSSRLKEAVEEFDPGQHQFFPVVVEDKKGAVQPGDFFIFNVVGRIESIIEDRSNFKANGRGDVKSWSYSRREGPWQCVLDAAVIGGRACWIEHRYGECWFVSDRLAAVLQERKLSGFDLDRHRHCDEVSL